MKEQIMYIQLFPNVIRIICKNRHDVIPYEKIRKKYRIKFSDLRESRVKKFIKYFLMFHF